MGTPEFAVPTLSALHAAGHDIAAVYCQQPRPAGRGQAMRRCPVHRRAEALGLTVHTPARLRSNQAVQAVFEALALDAAVVAAYGLLLPRAMLIAPRRGCLNVHASFLPRWRGAAPIQAAILAGDCESGITIMRMEEGLDTGPMLLTQAVPITGRTTAASLHDVLAPLGAALAVRALAENPAPKPQPETGVTYAPKLTRADGRIDWTRDASLLDRQIRGLNPWPGTETALEGEALKVLAAAPVAASGAPGTVLDSEFTVACGAGALRLLTVQRPGRKALGAAAFLRGHAVPPGTRLG